MNATSKANQATNESGMLAPARVKRPYWSTYLHIPTGINYRQLTPGNDVDWVIIGFDGTGTGESGGGSEQTLAQTLAFGNSMNSGQSIVASSGNTSFTLRDGVDGLISLTAPGTSLMFGNSNFDIISGDFLTDIAFASANLSPVGSVIGLAIANSSIVGQIAILENSTADIAGGAAPNYPSTISTQNYEVKRNLINSVIIGGIGIIAKTDNTSYSNQIGFNAGAAGEMLLKHTPDASDFIATLQAKTGTIAYLSDIGGGTDIYAADGTVGAGRVATLTDTLQFMSGMVGFGILPTTTVQVHGSFKLSNLPTTPAVGYVLQSTNITGTTDWVDPNTLISAVNTLYTANGNTGAARVVSLTDTLAFTGGLVGINKATPTEALDVVGNLAVVGQAWSKMTTPLVPGATLQVINFDLGNGIILDLGAATGDVTVSFTNPEAGATYLIKIIQGGTFRDVIFPANVKFSEETSPHTVNVTEVDDAIDLVVLTYDGANYIANYSPNHGGL